MPSMPWISPSDAKPVVQLQDHRQPGRHARVDDGRHGGRRGHERRRHARSEDARGQALVTRTRRRRWSPARSCSDRMARTWSRSAPRTGSILLLDANTMARLVGDAGVHHGGRDVCRERRSPSGRNTRPGPVDPAAAAAPPAPAFGRGGGGAPAVPMIPGRAWLLATTNSSIVAFEYRR